ncbi:MAG: AAA family ATPase [Actinomycetota bacterium]|nr:AAA family ATPase [Actinomycetota bacterium]
MARLVLINGAPGSGKSTLARMYVDEHPLTLALDVDVVRGMLGCWLDHAGEAGRIARRMALAMARVQLADGRDVLVPQFLGRVDFVLELERLCGEVAAEFVELVLLSSAEEAVARFVRRSEGSATAAHRDAQALLERLGGVEQLAGMYERLLDVVAKRPATCPITTIDGQVERAYRDLVAALDRS